LKYTIYNNERKHFLHFYWKGFLPRLDFVWDLESASDFKWLWFFKYLFVWYANYNYTYKKLNSSYRVRKYLNLKSHVGSGEGNILS